jgi:hypothetical protein
MVNIRRRVLWRIGSIVPLMPEMVARVTFSFHQHFASIAKPY